MLTIRPATHADASLIHRFVSELALYEREPDGELGLVLEALGERGHARDVGAEPLHRDHGAIGAPRPRDVHLAHAPSAERAHHDERTEAL